MECIPCILSLNTVIPMLLIPLPFTSSYYNFGDVFVIIVYHTNEHNLAMFHCTVFVLEGPFRRPSVTQCVMIEIFHIYS